MADSKVERPRFCSQCGEAVVLADASFCKNCGSPLASTVWFSQNITWRPLMAVGLSIIPGLGQWYKGQPRRALAWFIFVTFLYMTATPLGYLVHVICACNAGLAGAIREEAVANSASDGLRRRTRRWSGRGTPQQVSMLPPGL